MSLLERARLAQASVAAAFGGARHLDEDPFANLSYPVPGRMDSLYNPLTGLGDASVDKGASVTTSARGLLTDAQLDVLYTQWAYARRVVDILPFDATRKGWTVSIGDEVDVGAGIDKTFGVPMKVRRVLSWGRLYGLGAALFVTEDGGRTLEDELGDVQILRALQVFDGKEMAPSTWDDDPASDMYRDPSTFLLTPYAVSGGDLLGVEVDRSRFALSSGVAVPPSVKATLNGRGLSVLELYWDSLRDVMTHDRSTSGLAQEMSTAVLKIAGLKGAATGDKKKLVRARLEQFNRGRSTIGIGVLSDLDAYERHHLSASGWDELGQVSRRAMAAVEGIPQTRLFGDTPSGLNTDGEAGDRAMQAIVSAFQADEVEPLLRRIYTVALRAEGRDVEADDLVIKFHPLRDATPEEEANRRKTNAEADAIYVNLGVLDVSEVRQRFEGDTYVDDLQVDPLLADDLLDGDSDLDDGNVVDLPVSGHA